MKAKYDVVVTGAINLESIDGSPLELGGGGLSAAAAAARISKTKIIGCIGNDVENKEINHMNSIADELGLDIESIETVKGKTFRWFVKYSENKNTILEEFHDYGDYDTIIPNPKPVDTKVLLMATGHPNLQNTVLKSILSKYNPKYVLLDSKGVHIKKRFEQVISLLGKTNVFFATEEEMDLIFEHEETRNISQIFDRFKSLKIIVIKRGSKGGSVLDRDGMVYDYIAYAPNKVIDTTNAGDILSGTFAALLSKGDIESHEFIKTVISGAAEAAATSVTYKGKRKLINVDKIWSEKNTAKICLSKWK